MATVSDYFGCKAPARPAGRKSNHGLLVGIEVEIENAHLLAQPESWNIEKDGSLKDNGREFTLAVWHTHAYDYLRHLFKCLQNPKATSRCSVHIHCDVTTFTPEMVRNLILLYTIFERPLFHYSGKRWNNIYCVPVQTWAVGIQLENMSLGDMARHFPKYSALNVFPDDGKLGTVEFRHMAGNKNPLYITTWIEILASLVKYAKEQNFDKLKERIQDMRFSSQYWELFKEIFKENAQVLNYSNFDTDVEHGITFAKLITD